MNFNHFESKVQECLKKAQEMFNLSEDFLNVDIRFDLKGKTAAYAIRKNNKLSLRFNVEAIEQEFDDMINDTIPHEVAHLVCYVKPFLGKNHNHGWKRVCKKLGGTGNRTHSYGLTKAKTTYVHAYKLDDGTIIKLGTNRHNKIMKKGITYIVTIRNKNGSRDMRVTSKHFTGKSEVKE